MGRGSPCSSSAVNVKHWATQVFQFCARLQMITKVQQVLIWGVQTSFNKLANSQYRIHEQ